MDGPTKDLESISATFFKDWEKGGRSQQAQKGELEKQKPKVLWATEKSIGSFKALVFTA